MIRQIKKIEDTGIFRNFTWPDELPDCKRYNLIYGWNATGKTTLSNIFRYIELHRKPSEGSFILSTTDGELSSDNLVQGSQTLSIKVFNRGFVENNVFTDDGAVAPILFLGEENVEKKKDLDVLYTQHKEIQDLLLIEQIKKNNTERERDTYCSDQALSIKNILRSGGQNPYNNYDKRNYKTTLDKIKTANKQQLILPETEYNLLKKTTEAQSRPRIERIKIDIHSLMDIEQSTRKILEKPVTSQTIETLRQDADLNKWTETGLDLHRSRNECTCLFCGNDLPDNLLITLEKHFSRDYKNLISLIDQELKYIEDRRNAASSIKFPGKGDFYDDLQEDYKREQARFQGGLNKYILRIQQIADKLQQKKKNPFEIPDIVADNDTNDLTLKLEAVNVIIDKHNAKTSNLSDLVSHARQTLEKHFVAFSMDKHNSLSKEIEEVEKLCTTYKERGEEIDKKISELEINLKKHRRPAEELNQDLKAYLGRDELQFTIKDDGYQLLRYGKVAENLSEGEKTAIALLYFLKSLQDERFDLLNGIVVIDDPVSSLDSNSLFYAFGFIKERTQNAGQLFILTHDFAFFRQVKTWFHHIKKPDKPARFYMVRCHLKDGKRCSSISKLDPLLETYNSEYHYLFSLIWKGHFNSEPTMNLEAFYHLPNIARRLLETFLAFRKPNETGGLRKQFILLDFAPEKKARILQFLHTHSHNELQVDDPEHDISILSETPQVLSDVLDLIKHEDEKHFNEMKTLVSSTAT